MCTMSDSSEETLEGLTTEFVLDLADIVKRHWTRLSEIEGLGFAGAHMLIGALEQAQQKILADLNRELEKILLETYFPDGVEPE